jgi:hypothetical protein
MLTAKPLLDGFRLFLILIVVSLTTITALERINAATSWFAQTIQPIAFAQSEPAGQATYRLRLKELVLTNRIFPSQIRLINPGGSETSFTPRAASVEEVGRGLFTISHQEWLIFSRPDGFDPRNRNDPADLATPKVFSARLATSLTLLWLISVVGLIAIVPGCATTPQMLWARTIFLLRAALIWIGRHPALVLSVPSWYFLLTYPPLWKDVDALNQLVLPASATNILHFPAFYCFLARIPIWAGGFLIQPTHFNLIGLQHPTLAGIYLLLALQHVALVFSLAGLCRTIARDYLLRGVIVLLFLCSSAFYAQAQSCGSEAWGLIGLILVFMLGLRIYYANKPSPWHWFAYTGALTLAIGSRHIDILLGFWAVGLFLIRALARSALPKSSGRAATAWQRIGLTILAFVIAVSVDYEVTFAFASLAGVEPRSTLGRTLSDRIKTFLDVLPEEQREELASKLAAASLDPDVKAAIFDQAAIGSFYEGTGQAIASRLADEGYRGEALGAKMDRVMLQASIAYLRSFHPRLLGVILRDFCTGLFRASNPSIAAAPFDHNRYAGWVRMKDPVLWAPLDALRSTFFRAAVAWIDRAGKDGYLSSGSKVRIGLLYLVATILCVGCCFRRVAILDNVLPAASIMITGLVIFGATVVCEYYMSRFALPLQASALIGLSLAVVGIFQGSNPTCNESAANGTD